jgi:geranylgeranyl pyrophosphate synthase
MKIIDLPKDLCWSQYLSLGHEVQLDDYLSSALINPLEIFLGNHGKNIRPKLVELGLRLCLPVEDEAKILKLRDKLHIAASVIEGIHAGSLIIDDIQDASLIRRNASTLHMQHGVPLALNAGNWLYFWALEQIQRLELSAEKNQQLIFDVLRLMTRAHYGQALDLGVKIDEVPQWRVKDVSLASMELKTGTLFSLAFRLGAALSESDTQIPALEARASTLGIGLQAFDDVGNFLAAPSDNPSKRHEDLRHRRPTWVWAQAALGSTDTYQQFIHSVGELPDETALQRWIEQHDFKARLIESASLLLQKSREEFDQAWGKTHPGAMHIIKEICHQLERAYV